MFAYVLEFMLTHTVGHTVRIVLYIRFSGPVAGSLTATNSFLFRHLTTGPEHPQMNWSSIRHIRGKLFI